MARALSLVFVVAMLASLAVLASCSHWGGVYPVHHKPYGHQVPDLGAISDPYNPYPVAHGHGYPWLRAGAWHGHGHGYPVWGKPWGGAYPYGHHW